MSKRSIEAHMGPAFFKYMAQEVLARVPDPQLEPLRRKNKRLRAIIEALKEHTVIEKLDCYEIYCTESAYRICEEGFIERDFVTCKQCHMSFCSIHSQSCEDCGENFCLDDCSVPCRVCGSELFCADCFPLCFECFKKTKRC